MGQTGQPCGGAREILWDVFDRLDSDEFAGAIGLRPWLDLIDVESHCRRAMAGSAIPFLSAPWSRWLQPYRRDVWNEPIMIRARRMLAETPIERLCAGVAHRENVTAFHLERMPNEVLELLVKCGVRVAFSVGGGRLERDLLRAHGIAPLTLPYVPPRSPPTPAETKDILFSFIGGNSEPTPRIRPLIKSRFPGNPNVVLHAVHHWDAGADRSRDVRPMEVHYDSVLSRSRFALCPAGYSEQTVRFFEALAAGAIPIVLADDWEGPAGWDWDQTCVLMKPDEFEQRSGAEFEAFLAQIGAERESEMREHCLKAWERFQPSRLRDYIECEASKAPRASLPTPYQFGRGRRSFVEPREPSSWRSGPFRRKPSPSPVSHPVSLEGLSCAGGYTRSASLRRNRRNQIARKPSGLLRFSESAPRYRHTDASSPESSPEAATGLRSIPFRPCLNPRKRALRFHRRPQTFRRTPRFPQGSRSGRTVPEQ